jgi:hypothetical protein
MQAENAGGKLGVGGRGAKEVMDVLGLVGRGSRWGAEAEIKGEVERLADGGNAADNVGPINRTTIIGVTSCVRSFNKDGIGTAIVGSNGDGFIQESMKVLGADGLVITLCSNVEGDAKVSTDGFEGAFEDATIIDYDNAAKSDPKEEFLHEETGKIMGSSAISIPV